MAMLDNSCFQHVVVGSSAYSNTLIEALHLQAVMYK
jgi:hypothetical protein